MGGGTRRLPGQDVKRDLAMHVYLSYSSHSVYMERMFAVPGRLSSHPGKAGSGKNRTIFFMKTLRHDIMLTCKLSIVKSSRNRPVETFSCNVNPE